MGRPSTAARHTVIGEFGANARGAAPFSDGDGRLSAAVTVNLPRALVECRRLVADAGRLDAAVQRLGALLHPPVLDSGAAS